ncbi:MAG: CehA/McbA family metallohydrolase, partial [Myxococcota bacterium]
SDGADGTAAIVRAKGHLSPLMLLTGTLESDGLIQPRMVEITTDYILEPDSWLLRMDTHVLWKDVATPVQFADMAFMAFDVTSGYKHHAGRGGDSPETYGWTSIMGDSNELTLAIMQGEDYGEFVANAVLDTLVDLGPLLIGSNEAVTVSDGDEMEWSRYMGVASDLATLTDEWHVRRGDETETIGGIVQSGGVGLPGVRVHVLDADGGPVTMAVTDENGEYSASTPVGEATHVLADSRGSGVYFDRMPGSGWYGPYAAESVRDHTLQSIENGATPIAFHPGHGISEKIPSGENVLLTLTPPGTLQVNITAGETAVVRVNFTEGDPVESDPTLVASRPAGSMAWLYIRDGEGSIPLEPGTYSVVVHRGTLFEAHVETVTIESGLTTEMTATLEQSVTTNGLWSLDPHSHGSPSGDGSISMEGRLIVHAAHGVDVHFGTDHDHVADYRVLLDPLGLNEHLASIVADEVSPSLRGHHNVYPLESVPDKVNGGAFPWWSTWKDWVTTDGLYAAIREMASDGDIIVQANHPTSTSGLFSNADWNASSGVVRTGTHWSDDFDAFEVLNDGGYASVLPYYFDMVNRGMRPAPVGVSDSHSHRGGVGENRTWAPIDIDSITELTNDHIRQAIQSSGVIASHGPIIDARVGEQWAPGADFEGPISLDVNVKGPSWMPIDTLEIYANGELSSTIEIERNETTSIELNPSTDTAYILIATGTGDMSPVYPGQRPWALASAFFIDADGGGWEPPLPSLLIE